MKRLMLVLAMVAMPALAQTARQPSGQEFASDFQTVPVMGNTPGANGTTFQTYVALLNPTASSFSVQASLFDSNGTRHDATITLGAGELKTFQNFLGDVFGFTGGGAVTFSAPATVGGTHNNRFILSVEVRTSGTRFSTTIPALEFAGSSSRSFAAGVTVDANSRTNVGCFNQSSNANLVAVTVLDSSGRPAGGTANLVLAPNGWGQTGIATAVSGGYVQFDPSDSAVCYAVVVDNSSGDGRFMNAVEYRP